MLDDRLARAAERGDTSDVLSLISQTPPEWRSHQLYLALSWAAIANQTATMRALVDHGADVNATYYRGHRILSQAAQEGSLDAVRLLLTLGADVTARDPWGMTALDYARRYKKAEVVSLLEKHLGALEVASD